MQPDAAVGPKRRAVPLEAAALRVARAGRQSLQTADTIFDGCMQVLVDDHRNKVVSQVQRC